MSFEGIQSMAETVIDFFYDKETRWMTSAGFFLTGLIALGLTFFVKSKNKHS